MPYQRRIFVSAKSFFGDSPLTSTPPRLCLGTGRKPTSHRTASDHRVVSASSFSTLQQVRDTRLGIMGELFDVTERGINLRLAGSSEFDRWYKEVLDVLANLNQLNRLVAPLRGGYYILS